MSTYNRAQFDFSIEQHTGIEDVVAFDATMHADKYWFWREG